MVVLDRKFLHILIVIIFIVSLSIITLLFKSNSSPMPKIIPTETEISEKLKLLELNVEEAKTELKLTIPKIDKLEITIATKNVKEKLESLKSRVVESIYKLEFIKSELYKLRVSEENITKNRIKELIELCKILETNIKVIMGEVKIEMVKITNKDFTTAELFSFHEHLKSASAKLNNILRLLDELEHLVTMI